MSDEPIETQTYVPTQDERTFACISHLSVFVSSIGLLIAVGLWIYLRNRQPYAAFQAAQAVIFQVVVMILTFFVVMFLLAMVFGAFGIGMLSGEDPDGLAFGIFVSLLVVVFITIISVFTIALYAYAIYAAVRSWQGRPFRIPGIALIADSISPMPRVERRESAP